MWSICLFVTVHAVMCVCMCTHARVGASLGVALRGRGLPVHEHMPGAGLGHRCPLEISLVIGMIHPTKHDHTAVLWPSEKRRKKGTGWRRVTPGTVWGLCFSTNQRHYYSPHFKDVETEALRDWVPDPGQSLSNKCHRRGSKLSSLAWLWPPNLLKSAWSSPATWLLRYTLRGQHAWGVRLPPYLACNFSGKPKPEGALRVGIQAHPQLASLACDQCCPWGSQLSGLPISAILVLKFLICLTKRSHMFILHWLLLILLLVLDSLWNVSDKGNILAISICLSISNPSANPAAFSSNPYPDTFHCYPSYFHSSGPNCCPWTHEHGCVPIKLYWQKPNSGARCDPWDTVLLG